MTNQAKSTLLILLLVLLIAGGFFCLRISSTERKSVSVTAVISSEAEAPAKQKNQAVGATSIISSQSVAVVSSNYPPAAAGGVFSSAPAPEPSIIAPEIVVQNVRRAVRQYGDMFNGDPVGTNPEITSALSGNNPKKINFIDADAGMRVNEKGEMIDPWGTPYFFHQISGTEMEIHSAGPDRVLWTADDVVAK